LLQLALLAVTLGLDNLSVAVGLGLGGISRRRLWLLPLLFAAFQTAFPALGLLIGGYTSERLGHAASYVGFGLLIALGVYTTWTAVAAERRERELAGTAATVLLAVALSLDSLAVGFTLSFTGLPTWVVIGALGASAFVMSLLGLLFGDRMGRRVGEWAEVAAGVVLTLTGIGLLIGQVVS
jgi:putative Mn2+ efflux pump MntP